ncbi:MAG: MOSC domain-containing protein [Vulcanimicrobiaceae bacterium]
MRETHPLGHVEGLWRYPIKSLAAEALQCGDVLARGIAGDRHAALFVTTPDRPRSGKPYRGKENPFLHTVASAAAATELARAREIELARHDDGPYYDLEPVSILFDTWLADVERPLAMVLDPLRFRPNIFARAAAGFDASEADLVDRVVRIGDVRLRITQPIERCVTPTYDIATGATEPRVLTHLVRVRNNEMGVYARVIATGAVARGDALELEAP